MELPGNLDSLKTIRDYVMAEAAQFGLGQQAAYRLALAVDEIATNIINYGYEGRGGPIRLTSDVHHDRLRIVLEDESPRYDPRERPKPESLDAPLDERPIGGLGIYLALNGVDQFDYEYVDGKNRNIFIMNRPGS